MNGIGLQDLELFGGALADRRKTGSTGDGSDADAFWLAMQQAGNAREPAAPGPQSGSPAGGRHSLASTDEWDDVRGTAHTNGIAPSSSSAAEQLAEYVSMPLSERMFYMVLASMGVSKEEYDAMSPDEKAKLADQVGRRLKENAEAQKQAAQEQANRSQAAPIQIAQDPRTQDPATPVQAVHDQADRYRSTRHHEDVIALSL
jgi:hypothetical protein